MSSNTKFENKSLKFSLPFALTLSCVCVFTSIGILYYKYTKKAQYIEHKQQKKDVETVINVIEEKIEITENKKQEKIEIIKETEKIENNKEVQSVSVTALVSVQGENKIDESLSPKHILQDDQKHGIPEIEETQSHEYTMSPVTKKEKESIKIREVNNSPLELRKRFNNKGFIFAHQNLATVNVELNEFIELMRRYDLNILDGCKDPNKCDCTFRHKRCRLFMIRKYSSMDEMQYYSPHCSGVTTISPSNVDILMGTPIYEFVQMFQNKFSDRIMDLISYVNYIVASDCNEELDYVVDVTMIADPYYNYENKIEENNTNNKCTSYWHQDHFVETKSKQYHSYDIIALFVLNAVNITPHKLMIGKLKPDVDVSGMTLGQIQEHISLSSEFMIDSEICSDIGYVIDQRKNFFHKHSDFSHQGYESRRNIITIRIKYLK